MLLAGGFRRTKEGVYMKTYVVYIDGCRLYMSFNLFKVERSGIVFPLCY